MNVVISSFTNNGKLNSITETEDEFRARLLGIAEDPIQDDFELSPGVVKALPIEKLISMLVALMKKDKD